MTKKSEMFISHGRSDTPRILFVYCKLAGTKNPRLHKGPKHLGESQHATTRSWCPHSDSNRVFWGRLGFDERSILQWSQIQQLDIADVANHCDSSMDSYGFFYQFLWIPLDSKPWNWRKEWQKAVLTCHCILWCCNLRESWIDHDRFVTNTMVSRDLHQKLWTGWLGSTSFPFSKLLEQTERKTSLQQANSHIVCWTWWFWEMKRGKVFGLFGCYLQPLSGSDLALEFFFFTWFREVWKRDREELIYIFMPQILHDVWKYVQKEFFVVGHSLEHVENMVQKWECVEVLEG